MLRMTAQVVAEMSYKDGSWPAFSSVGCYTLLYVDEKNGDCLCAACAKDAWESDKHDVQLICDTYDEGPVLHCEGCNAEIESSYGDPDTENV